jgi:hypothetical protein
VVMLLFFCYYDVIIYVNLVNSICLFCLDQTTYVRCYLIALSGYLLCSQLVTVVSCLVL